jgi:DNA-binding MarR family transcriptional regulator
MTRSKRTKIAAELHEANYIGFLLSDVSRLSRILIERAIKPLPITSSQWWILLFLTQRDGMTQTELADGLDRTKVAVGTLLERMERLGMIERRPDKSDARMRRVFLTAIGERLRDSAERHLAPTILDILHLNTAEELTVLERALEHMKETLLQMIEKLGKTAAGRRKRRAKTRP